MKNIDILTIGDVATDVFIKIKDAEATCDADGAHCKLCLTYGGKIPYESALVCNGVGNSSNVAVAASRLGLNSSLISYVGNDVSGKENLLHLGKENVNTDYVSIVNDKESNYHYVLWYKTDRTILVKHTEFPYSLQKDIIEPKWVYLSSLASNSIEYHKEIIEYVKSHPSVSLAFQPGTFQIKLGIEELKEIYKIAKVFLCNYQEAQKILSVQEKDIYKLSKAIYDFGPKIVVITDGVNGSYSYDGNDMLFMKAIDKDTVESTGAGDAFSGAFISALTLGKDIPTAMIWGAVNATSVVEHIGPQKGLLTKDEIEEHIKNLSIDYKPVKLN